MVGGNSLTLYEVNQAAEVIKQAVDPEANIIFGVAHDENMDNQVKITLIATGFMSKLGASGEVRDEELEKLLKGMKTEDELDVPSFLRRPMLNRRQAMTQPAKVIKPVHSETRVAEE